MRAWLLRTDSGPLRTSVPISLPNVCTVQTALFTLQDECYPLVQHILGFCSMRFH